jgi:hypothetical protein
MMPGRVRRWHSVPIVQIAFGELVFLLVPMGCADSREKTTTVGNPPIKVESLVSFPS